MEGVGRTFPEVHVTECTAQLGKARVSFEACQPQNIGLTNTDTDTFISSPGESNLAVSTACKEMEASLTLA